MKKILKRLSAAFLAVCLLGAAAAAPVIKRGYDMYKQAVEQTPIEQKVNEIRSSDAYTPLDEISGVFVETLLQSEDKRFYYHFGIDPIAFVRAMAINISQGQYVQGGSTITQQLAKNMYFSIEKKLARKVAELFVAFQLEKMYSKDDILAMYCSLAYFGENCYGVKQASQYYYSVSPSQLDRQQSRQLVEALKAPSVHNPSTMQIQAAS